MAWLRKLPLRKQLRKRADHHRYFLTVDEFRHEATCERMRVDRNGSQLAVLVIRLAPDRRSSADYAFLADVLSRRLRVTDTAGLLPDERIGVLLPDTSESGAWKVASDMCEVYEVGRHRPACEVYVYPDQRFELPGESEQPVEQPVTGHVSSNVLDAFLAQETPAWKRAIDIIGAAVGLVVTSPLIAIAGLAIKLTSPGPMFFAQEREGLAGRRFRMYKLRTMWANADHDKRELRPFSEQDGPAFKMTDDPRITAVGYWLRLTSLDELPQFWNVLVGHMSLVGPRPLPTDESLQCDRWQRRRLLVKPGMTCIWQVRGRSCVSFNEWIRMDLHYMRHRSLWFDLRLLMLTVPALFVQRGPR
jgi:lipopolysaccharide/colanic/teichoic acid biosynthesis glycosyltransferase